MNYSVENYKLDFCFKKQIIVTSKDYAASVAAFEKLLKK